MILSLRRWTQRGEPPKSSNLKEVAAARCERPRVGPHTPAAEASIPKGVRTRACRILMQPTAVQSPRMKCRWGF